ncbi:MAG: FHA domain-containing protein, partial [Chloroflexi bacterium]|nr:FHA domain-containing protein [Chloroflexota bacterium]
NRHYLRDLGSRNGTFVNETLVVTPVVLKNNDTIRIGGAILNFTTNAKLESAPLAAPKQVKTEFIKKESDGENLGRLITYSGATIGLNFVLKPPSATLGRDPESNDISLHNQTVSRNHVRFDWRKDKWYVIDLGSGNGTHINGKQLDPNIETPLASKDEVQFGDVKLMYVAPSSSSQPTPNLPMTFIIEPEPEPPAAPVEPPKIIPSKPPVVDKTPSIQAKAEYLQNEIARIMEKRESTPQPLPAEVKPPTGKQAAEGVGGEATQFIPSTFPTRLTLLAGPGVGRVIPLVHLPLTLGRTTAPDVQGLDDPLVSRQHLKVTLAADGNICVSDLGSVNGTILNGIRLEINQITILKKGDELRMGSTVLKAE